MNREENLKEHLDKAFQLEEITVHEELIAKTMQKIQQADQETAEKSSFRVLLKWGGLVAACIVVVVTLVIRQMYSREDQVDMGKIPSQEEEILAGGAAENAACPAEEESKEQSDQGEVWKNESYGLTEDGMQKEEKDRALLIEWSYNIVEEKQKIEIFKEELYAKAWVPYAKEEIVWDYQIAIEEENGFITYYKISQDSYLEIQKQDREKQKVQISTYQVENIDLLIDVIHNLYTEG